MCPSPQQLGPHQQEEEGGQQAPCPEWVQQQIRLQTAGNNNSEHQLVITTLLENREAGSSLAGQLTSAITKPKTAIVLNFAYLCLISTTIILPMNILFSLVYYFKSVNLPP